MTCGGHRGEIFKIQVFQVSTLPENRFETNNEFKEKTIKKFFFSNSRMKCKRSSNINDAIFVTGNCLLDFLHIYSIPPCLGAGYHIKRRSPGNEV